MFHVIKITIAALTISLVGVATPALAHHSRFPLTRCGPGLEYLCRIHGFFDQPPFHYSLAIYPGCIRSVRVSTPRGIAYRRTIVCSVPERSMVWW